MALYARWERPEDGLSHAEQALEFARTRSEKQDSRADDRACYQRWEEAVERLRASLAWLDGVDGLFGVDLGGQIRAGVSLRDRRLLLHERGDEVAATSLVGLTLRETFNWLSRSLARRGPLPATVELALPDYDLPAHPVAASAVFEEPDQGAQEALHGWFSEAVPILRRIRAEQPGAGEIRCWPHHFDLASLIRVGPDAGSGDDARSIGVGLSPGDGKFPDPYYYVTPYPAPDRLPPLSIGLWHTSEWFGALLCAAEIDREPTPDARVERIVAFLRSAIGGLRGMLEA